MLVIGQGMVDICARCSNPIPKDAPSAPVAVGVATGATRPAPTDASAKTHAVVAAAVKVAVHNSDENAGDYVAQMRAELTAIDAEVARLGSLKKRASRLRRMIAAGEKNKS
jgi:hypothetical protein